MGKKKKSDARTGQFVAPPKADDKVILNMNFEQAMKKALTTSLPLKSKKNK